MSNIFAVLSLIFMIYALLFCHSEFRHFYRLSPSSDGFKIAKSSPILLPPSSLTLRLIIQSKAKGCMIDSTSETPLLTVSVFSGHHKKTPLAGWFKQQTLILSQFWRLGVRDRGAGKFIFW